MPLELESAKKAPGSKLDYGFDWSNWLATGETILASSWTVEEGLTKEPADTFTSTATTLWVSGGTQGVDYTVMNQITTSAGRTPKRSIIIYVRER